MVQRQLFASGDASAGALNPVRRTIVPPAFSIFSLALAEKACALTVSLFVTSPSPSTLIRTFLPWTRRAL